MKNDLTKKEKRIIEMALADFSLSLISPQEKIKVKNLIKKVLKG